MTAVRKEITVNAPRETVWRYFEDPDLLAGWLMRNNFTGELQKQFQFLAQPSDDWTSFDLYVAIDAEPSTILSAWSTIKGMESFFVQMMRITGPDGTELEHGVDGRDKTRETGASFSTYFDPASLGIRF